MRDPPTGEVLYEQEATTRLPPRRAVLRQRSASPEQPLPAAVPDWRAVDLDVLLGEGLLLSA